MKYLESQILKAIQADSPNSLKFNVDFDPKEKEDTKTNMDEIMTRWALPKFVKQALDLEEICEILVTAHNEIPLWIRIQKATNGDLYNLFISKRFRKMKVVNEWHKGNSLKPIILE